MTTTRKYYESLIDLFAKINLVKQNEVELFLETKTELSNLIDRIIKFNLFPLSFTNLFFETLHKRTIENFLKEKIILSNELHYELNECLWTTRLRYGGELLFYIYEIRIAYLNLSVEEIDELEKDKKEPIHYFMPEVLKFKNVQEKIAKLEEVKKTQKKSIVKKEKVIIKKSDYEIIEGKLQMYFSDYKNYISTNYPSICDSFSYYDKDVRAYITEAISNDIFELRLHSYKSDSKSSITLKNEYYNFYPAYFYNLEEIANEQIDAMALTLFRSNFLFKNPFSIEDIHYALVRIFIENSTEIVAIDFAKFLLKCDGYKFIKTGDLQNKGFDLLGEKSNKKTQFEIYHHKSRSSNKLVEKATKFYNTNLVETIFVFTTFPGKDTIDLLKTYNISSLFLFDLIGKYFENENTDVLSWYIKSNLDSIKPKKINKNFEASILINRLKNCPTGNKDWAEYETIGADIFRFLFADNFKSYIAEEQFETDLKNHRRDLIVSNYPKDSTSFWAEVKHEYKSKAIIIDFKNYSEKLNSTTLFSVTKYITKKVGNFAIVFSRKGIDNTAVNEQKTLLSSDKLLIEFNDNELIEMINEKVLGKDPLDRLKSKEFELIRR